MPSRALQVFIGQVFDIAVEKCGREFADQISSLRRERERLLRNSWRELPPEKLLHAEKQEIFREIDFDTIILHAARYMKQKDYLAFLYEVAEIAIGFGEFDKAHRLLNLITTRYYRSAGRPLLARTHQRLGDIAFYQNNLRLANSEFHKSRDLYDGLGDTKGIAAIKNSMGVVMVERGDLSEGESLFLEAKKLAKEGDFKPLLIKANLNLGNVYHMHGSWEEAMACYKEALVLLGKEGYEDMRAQIHHNIAIVYKQQGEYSKAMEHLHKSIMFSTDANNRYEKALAYLDKAEVSCRQGEFAAGTALATSAFQIFSELGDRLSMADVYKVFGMINRESKRYDVALSYFENSLRINQDYNNPLNLGETLFELGKYYVVVGNPEKAVENFKSALVQYKQVQAKAKMAEVQQAITSLTN